MNNGRLILTYNVNKANQNLVIQNLHLTSISFMKKKSYMINYSNLLLKIKNHTIKV